MAYIRCTSGWEHLINAPYLVLWKNYMRSHIFIELVQSNSQQEGVSLPLDTLFWLHTNHVHSLTCWYYLYLYSYFTTVWFRVMEDMKKKWRKTSSFFFLETFVDLCKNEQLIAWNPFGTPFFSISGSNPGTAQFFCGLENR